LIKAFITGIRGSAGSYLSEYLSKNPEIEVHGTSRQLPIKKPDYTIHQCDLLDFSSIFQLLVKIKPNYIFHIASNADVRMSFSNPLAMFNNNTQGTLNLLEAIHVSGIDTIVQMCSTSEVYGQVADNSGPIKETQTLNPQNIYAVSKLAQEKLSLSYYYMYKIPVVVTRAFCYINPRRKNIFSTAFAIQIAQIESGQKDKLHHGNLQSIRTMLDAREVVEAYFIATQKCEAGECYNIGSSVPVSVHNVLQRLLNKSTMGIKTQVDNELLRPNDVTLQIPDTTKFYQQTGWQPSRDLDDSLDYLLAYCRKHYV